MKNKSKNSNKIPKFSIIISTYNRANILPRAIRSVLNQTFQDFELIIVDDGSTDNTEKLIKNFNDKRMIYLKHKENKGVYAGINTGLKAAKGDFVITLGDDDDLYPDALESVFSKIEEHSSKGVKILWFDAIDLDTGKCASLSQKKEKYISYEDLLCDRFRIDPVFVIDRNLFRQKRIEERSWSDSGTIWLGFYHENPKYLPLYIPKVICKTRSMHGKHMSYPETSIENVPGVIFAQRTFLARYEKELKRFCPNRYGQRLAMLGFYQVLQGEKKEGKRNIRESLKFNFSLRYYFLFLLSSVLNKNQIKYLYTKFFKARRQISSFFIPLRKLFYRVKISQYLTIFKGDMGDMSEYVVFIKRIGLVGITKFITSFRGLILLPILTKTLGAGYYGVWSLILITLGLLTPFVTLSLSSSMVRFLPAEKKKENVAKGIFTVIFTILFISIIFALALFLLSDSFANILLKDASASFFIKIAAILLILEALNQTTLEPFRIFGQIRKYSTLTVLQTLLEIGLVSFLVLFGFGLSGALIALLITRGIILLLSLSSIIFQTGFAFPDFSILSTYLAFALPLVPMGLLDTVVAFSDRYVIGFFKEAASVGIYSAAYNIGLIAGVFIYPIVYILSPTIFKLFDEKKIEKVKTYLSYSLKYFFLFSIPSVFGLTILAKTILNTLTTSEFASIQNIFIVLVVSLSTVFYGIQAIFGEVLMLIKRTRFFVIAFGAAAVINLVLNIILVPYFGILAAAITTLIAYVLISIIIYYKSHQYLKFKVNLDFIVKSVLASLVMITAIYIFKPIGIIKILLAIGIGAVIYFCLILLLKGLKKEEIKTICEALKFKNLREEI